VAERSSHAKEPLTPAWSKAIEGSREGGRGRYHDQMAQGPKKRRRGKGVRGVEKIRGTLRVIKRSVKEEGNSPVLSGLKGGQQGNSEVRNSANIRHRDQKRGECPRNCLPGSGLLLGKTSRVKILTSRSKSQQQQRA